ncbi:MAG: DUF3443 domain-containing protein [Herminiimonas sp.]|nr:DUF3443 domain-containing protein [Herminiimonas sp.]
MSCNKSPRTIHSCGTVLLIVLFGLLQAACGGGGGSTATTTTLPVTTPPAITPPVTTPPVAVSNTQPLVIDAGPADTVNTLFTSVTVCVPGSTTSCQTIDHIQVDTGSVGLRLLASVVQPSLKLPQNTATNGNALVECTQFADGYSWGPVRSADVRLAGQTASAVPIQIIGDAAFTVVPADCSSSGPAENTVKAFGANGILGIGNFTNDCGIACATSSAPGAYYACSAASCLPTTASATQQVQHPVAMLTTNNNGVVLQLPAIAEPGATATTGTMTFGIGTQANNALGTAKVLTIDPLDGTFNITLAGKTYPGSFIDSGSNAYFYPSPSTPLCTSGFFCPASPQALSVLIQGKNGANSLFNFNITNADSLFSQYPTFTVLPTLGGAGFDNTTVDLGIGFYLGRSVYTAIEGRSTPGGVGPFIAF